MRVHEALRLCLPLLQRLRDNGVRLEDIDYQAREACRVLEARNSGYTFTNLRDHLTIMLIGEPTDPAQLYDTCQHEVKHATEHISEFYGVDPRSEESAYLQGEIARNMFGAAAMLFCPKCGKLSTRH